MKVYFDIDAHSVVPAPPVVVEQAIAGLPCGLIFPAPSGPIAILQKRSEALRFTWRSVVLIDPHACWISGLVYLIASVRHIGGTGIPCL